MKKHLIYIIGIAAALFTACENIDEEDRFIEVEGVTAQRVVLLEDYTGQACLNCPNAHAVAAELHDSYHENLIVVAIHAGQQALSPAQNPMGLKQPEGDVYATSLKVQAYPVGVINRRGGLKDYQLWGGEVSAELQRETNLNLAVSATASEGKLAVSVEMEALADLSGKLQLWLVEDSIVAPQILPDKTMKADYVHNHVFRDAINDTWGEEVTLALGEVKNTSVSEFVLDASWNVEHLSVVAFVYNNDGVLQAAKAEVESALTNE